MIATDNCLKLIKKFEGFRKRPYICPGGYPTIGYGHVNYENYVKLSRSEAYGILKKDICMSEECIKKSVKVKINQNMFDALASFIFNVGRKAFKDSTMLKYLNDNKLFKAADEFDRWIYVNKKVSRGLKRRRKAEKKLYLS